MEITVRRQLAFWLLIVCAAGCGSSATPAAPTGTPAVTVKLTPDTFAPALGTVLHLGDPVTFSAFYGVSPRSWFALAIAFVREDGMEDVEFCGTNEGTGGGGGYRGRPLQSGEPLYKFGLGHTLNAVLVGATFPSKINLQFTKEGRGRKAGRALAAYGRV